MALTSAGDLHRGDAGAGIGVIFSTTRDVGNSDTGHDQAR